MARPVSGGASPAPNETRLMPQRVDVHAHFMPSMIPAGVLAKNTAVVVDVLRATTVIVQALEAGCESVIPCAEVSEAQELAGSHAPGSVLLCGERQGVPIPGFDLGNSPGDFKPSVCRGKTLIMTTTNGTRAILSCQDAQRILILSFANLGATAHAIRAAVRRQPVHVVCAGTEREISFEDCALAGALVWELTMDSPGLPGQPFRAGNDEAQIVQAMWKGLLEESDRGEPLTTILSRGRGGQLIQQLGLKTDIRESARVDYLSRTFEVRRNPLRVVAMDS